VKLHAADRAALLLALLLGGKSLVGDEGYLSLGQSFLLLLEMSVGELVDQRPLADALELLDDPPFVGSLPDG
jgi:hypothetical protein